MKMITKLDNGKFSVLIGGLTVYFDTRYQASKFYESNLDAIVKSELKRIKPKKQVKAVDYTNRDYTLTQFSSNVKLSNNKSFATVSGSHSTCPTNCAFIKNAKGSNGCYGDNYGMNFHFDAIGIKKGLTGFELIEKMALLPKHQKIRLFDVGDVPNKDGIMDYSLLNAFSRLVRERSYSVIQFTHNVLNYTNVQIAKKLHYTLNFSCETVNQAKNAINQGVNAVLVVNSKTDKVKACKVDDITLITCPAQWQDLKLSNKAITCADCMLCSKDRVKQKNIVVFYSHGSSYKKIDNALNLINLKG